MFSGIVEACGQIKSIIYKDYFLTYTVKFPSFLLKNLEVGASVANNGCCLTVTSIHEKNITFDIMKETLIDTNLKYLKVGDFLNIERSLRLGDEVGGHLISGHINSVAKIYKIVKTKNNLEVYIDSTNKFFKKYLFSKGFICIDGVSLTVGKIWSNCFCINLIPETLFRTIFKNIRVNQLVNVEVDFITQIVVDVTEKLNNKVIS